MNAGIFRAWMELGVVPCFYIAISVALRLRRHPTITVRYGPPEKVSPAKAAYLIENGRCELAFAAGIVSLAVKGYVGIKQGNDRISLTKIREIDNSLPAEEITILETLCQTLGYARVCSTVDYVGIGREYQKFRAALRKDDGGELLSPNTVSWWAGILLCLPILVLAWIAEPRSTAANSSWGVPYLCLWIFLGGIAAVAALRTWPSTIKKLSALIPGRSGPVRKFSINDMVPMWCSLVAAGGFGFLIYLTSLPFAELLAGAFVIVAAFRYVLTAPTSLGRQKILELQGFREFLARTDSDRLTRENLPDITPNKFETFTAYAVALGAEHGWGEEFTSILVKLIELDDTYAFNFPEWSWTPKPRREIDQLSDDVIVMDLNKTAARRKEHRKLDDR